MNADNTHHDVIVVGAGIAGLTAGLVAAEAGQHVLVLDAHTPGGRARSTERDGYWHNIGPHALYRAGHLHALLERRGVVLPGGPPDTDQVRMLRDGRLTPLTLKPVDLMRTPLLGFRDRMRLLALFARLQKIDTAGLVGRSVADWLADTPRPVAQFVESLIRTSTYTNGPDVFDAGAAIDQVRAGFLGVDYLDHGWESIVNTLRNLLTSAGGVIETGAAVAAVEAEPDRVAVQLPFRTLTASSVVLAAGGPDVAERLTGIRPADVDNLTAPIEATSLDLALRTPHRGLVLGLDEPLYLSSHGPNGKLAPEGCGLVSALRYVPVGSDVPPPDAARSELRRLATLAGIADDEAVHERYLHRSTVVHGAPTAAGGGLAGRPRIDALGLPGVFLAGDWVGPIGLLADAAAASGEAAASAAARHGASVAA